MTQPKCPKCGGRTYSGKVRHDKSCPTRFEPAPAGLILGRLTTSQPLDDSMVLRKGDEVARWLVYAGCGGRFAYATGRGWHRYNGKGWRPVPADRVREAVRVALTDVCERRADASAYRLLGAEHIFWLVNCMKAAARVDAADLGLGAK